MDSCFVLFRYQPRQPFGCSSGQLHGWLAARQVFNPHVAPEDAVPKPSSQSFGTGLLGRETLGVRCCALSAFIGFGPLRLRENPIKKAVSVAADRFFDAPDVDHVASLPQLAELNIGHFIIGEAIYTGLGTVIKNMRAAIARGVAQRSSVQQSAQQQQ